MTRRTIESLSLFQILLALGAFSGALGGCAAEPQLDEIPDYSTPEDGDDTVTGDDDASPGDDDTTAGDDDATMGDDDASAGDDDATGGDDDATGGDDDATGGDDDATGGDDGGLEPVDASGAAEIQIVNDNGAITLVGEADRTEVEVTATYLGGSEEDYGDVAVAMSLEDQVVLVVVDVPSDLSDVRVDLTISAPASLDFEVRNGTGDVTLSAMEGRGEVVTGTGDIYGDGLTGGLQIVTTSGVVDVHADPASTPSIDIIVGAGPINLGIPKDISAQLTATTEAGIVSTLNLGSDCYGTTTSVQCTLGTGTGNITLVTGNGNIKVSGE